MDPARLFALPGLLSAPRMSGYLHKYPRPDLAMRLYSWNLELAGALIGPISVLEVVVRNSLHTQLADGYGEQWWEHQRLTIMDRERRAINSVLDSFSARNLSPSANDVVAATSFGLWVGLTDAGIARHPTLDYETKFWQPRLRNAFPHRGSAGRKLVHSKLDRIRQMRNRVAHHEPIFNTPNLRTVLADIIEVAGYVHPEAAIYIQDSHRVDEVLNRQQAAITTGNCTF